MTARKNRIAIVFPADAQTGLATRLETSRLSGVADAFTAAGAEVVGAPFADEFAEAVRAKLVEVDAALVWFNPNEGGRDRSVLNAVLKDIAARGVLVSAHPDAIDRIGTKEVLYRTQEMTWGCDTGLYRTANEMRDALPASLASGARVLKRIRGQSGDGVWKVERANLSSQTSLRVRHAKRGSIEQVMTLEGFLEVCAPYFGAGGGMIDQPFQPRLSEGMVRCYVVGTKVAGFGEQLVNALYPAPPGAKPADAPQPGPRLYYPATRADFQRLKTKLEGEWVSQLCSAVGLDMSLIPVLWDVDFLYGPKGADGADSYVLCEINVSSVYPFPPSALAPLVAETMARIRSRRG